MNKFLLIITLVGLVWGRDTLIVDINEFDPMVIIKDNEYSGFDVELWKAVASKANIPYKFSVVTDFDSVFARLSKNVSDVGLSGITITKEREKIIDFSHSYFQSGLSILLRTDEKQTFLSEMCFFGTIVKGIIPYALIFIGLMFIVGILIVLLERKTNPQFKHIIWDGMYWANVILATVGLGDKCPTTKGGKALTMILMSVGIFFITPIIISKISSEMTVHKMTESISCKEDLKKKLVGAIKNTTSETAMKKLGAKHFAYENMEKAVESLKRARIDAVVFDLPAIKYEDNRNDDLKAASFTFDKQDYGIALSKGSPYRKSINLALLSLKEDGTYDKIYQKYFGEMQ